MSDTFAEHDSADGSDHALSIHQDTVVGAAAAPRKMPLLILGGVALAAVLGYYAWTTSKGSTHVPVVVPAANAHEVGTAIQHAGISVQWREGLPWVAAADAARAGEIAAGATRDARPANPVANAVGEESVFMSSEAARARRLVATMSAVEQMIEAQSGVARARVVLSEAGRAGAPGSAYSGPTAAATVAMTHGAMSQDLVDSVAALVCGALPGLTPEHVAVIDARTNRHRTARTAEARHAADAMRDREALLAERLRTGIPGANDAQVTVHLDDSGGVTAALVFGPEYGQRVARRADASWEASMAAEESRVAYVAECLLCDAARNGEIHVVVNVERALEPMPPMAYVASAPAVAAPLRTEVAPAQPEVGSEVSAAVERERTTPLGPNPSSRKSWDAGTLALLGLAMAAVVFAAYVASRKTMRNKGMSAGAGTGSRVGARLNARSAVGHAALAGHAAQHAADVSDELQDASHDATHDAHDAHDDAPDQATSETAASEAVLSDPSTAAAVLRSWLLAGYDTRVAHVVVALDSAAAGALLRAMSPGLVNRVTSALTQLRSPDPEELTDAVTALQDEMALTPNASADELVEAGAAEDAA